METPILNNKLFVVWQDNNDRIRHVIGELIKNNGFQFRYFVDKVKELKDKGFNSLVAFSDIEKTYTSTYLFPSFALRLPDKRRKDISKVLDFYNLETYDEFELLRKSGGKLPIDSLEFIDPINLSNSYIERDFYLALTTSNNNISSLNENDKLQYKLDLNNKFYENDIQILHNNCIIGYMPSYFSKEIIEAIKLGRNLEIKIVDTKQVFDQNWQQLIKLKLIIN